MMKKTLEKKLKSKLKPHLSKTKKRNERVRLIKNCIRHEICPKCGEKFKYKELPRGPDNDYLVFYGVWTCSPCKIRFDTHRQGEFLAEDSMSVIRIEKEFGIDVDE